MIQSKSVAIYKNEPAFITETGDKYTITYCTAIKKNKQAAYASQKVRSKDISILHNGPATSFEKILSQAQNDDFINNIREKLAETWELLLSDEETAEKPMSIKDLSEFSTGSWNPDDSWAFYKTTTEDLHFMQATATYGQKEENTSSTFSSDEESFIPLPFFLPRSNSDFLDLCEKEKQKENADGMHSAFIERLKQHKLILPDDIKLAQDIEALALGKTGKSKTLKEAGITETPERAHRLLLDCKIWPISRNPYPSRWGLSTTSATERLPSPPKEERTTIGGTAFAIDSEWSSDPDDAIAYDGTYVWIHIADPASAVTPDSEIDKAARCRGSTLYIPEGAARMLAEESLEDYALGLIEEDISLPESDRFSKALSFRLLLDDKGAILDTTVLKTLVCVKRLTYIKADELKNTPELSPLFAIAARNENRRKQAGAVSIQLPEVHISVTNGNTDTDSIEKTVSITPITQTESSTVVREFMLLAGEGAAKFAFRNNIPFPFVSQEPPDIPSDIPEGFAGQYRLRRCMRSRSVGISPSQHAGLGLGMYSQVTSPLRRYSDLIAHEQLRSFIDKKTLIDKDTMLERISAGDAAGSASVKAERKSNLHWTLVYLLQHPDWTGQGIAVDYKGKQTVFLIPELALETIINTSKQIPLNDSVTLSAGNINLPELSVTFKIQN